MKDLLSRHAYPVMFEVGGFEYVESDGPDEITGDQVILFRFLTLFTPLNVPLDDVAAYFLKEELLPRVEGYHQMIGGNVQNIVWAGRVAIAIGMN